MANLLYLSEQSYEAAQRHTAKAIAKGLPEWFIVSCRKLEGYHRTEVARLRQELETSVKKAVFPNADVIVL